MGNWLPCLFCSFLGADACPIRTHAPTPRLNSCERVRYGPQILLCVAPVRNFDEVRLVWGAPATPHLLPKRSSLDKPTPILDSSLSLRTDSKVIPLPVWAAALINVQVAPWLLKGYGPWRHIAGVFVICSCNGKFRCTPCSRSDTKESTTMHRKEKSWRTVAFSLSLPSCPRREMDEPKLLELSVPAAYQ